MTAVHRRRWGAAAFWIAGANHFLRPRFYEAIVPPPLDRWKSEVSALAGEAELPVQALFGWLTWRGTK